jgi:DNA-binding LacI/PurR family transcriptional regulator
MTGIEGERYTPAITGFEVPEEKMLQSLLRLLDDAIKGGGQGCTDVAREFMGRLVIRQSVRSME